MKFCTLSSGSSGNCVFLSHGNTKILIDCGRSGKQIAACLANIDVSPDELDYILVTHEHSDHVNGIGVLSRQYDIPIYATSGTWDGIHKWGKLGKVSEKNMNELVPFQPLDLGDICVLPFDLPHDAQQPVGYRFLAGETVVALATDIGHLSESVVRGVAGAKVVLLESNHDVDMVNNGSYPYFLKKRILGSHGHLSNEHAAAFASYLAANGTEYILLGHLSEENNIPEKAYQATADAMKVKGINCKKDIFLAVAHRYTNSEVINL